MSVAAKEGKKRQVLEDEERSPNGLESEARQLEGSKVRI